MNHDYIVSKYFVLLDIYFDAFTRVAGRIMTTTVNDCSCR